MTQARRNAKLDQGLIETIMILSDPVTAQSLQKSFKQAKAGRWVSHEAVFGREGQPARGVKPTPHERRKGR